MREQQGATASGLEQRVVSRIAAELELRLYLAGHREPFPLVTRNFGPGGLCVRSSFPFALAEAQSVELKLENTVLALEVEGAWQREDLMEDAILTGLRFHAPTPEATMYLWQSLQMRAIELSRFLHQKSALEGLEMADARDLALVTSLRKLDAGVFVYRQDSSEAESESIFVVYEGRIQLEGRVNREHEVWIGNVEAGGVFGAFPLLSGVPPTESAVADCATTLLEIDRATFEHLLGHKPRLARVLARGIRRNQSAQMRGLIDRILEHGAQSPVERPPCRT